MRYVGQARASGRGEQIERRQVPRRVDEAWMALHWMSEWMRASGAYTALGWVARCNPADVW